MLEVIAQDKGAFNMHNASKRPSFLWLVTVNFLLIQLIINFKYDTLFHSMVVASGLMVVFCRVLRRMKRFLILVSLLVITTMFMRLFYMMEEAHEERVA